MKIKTSLLVKAIPPWILGIPGEPDSPTLIEQELAELGATARVLQGMRMRTVDELLSEFAFRFQFPAYFGRNWDALTDCLTDLSWLPGLAYVVVIDQARYLLDSEATNTTGLFLHVMEEVSERWAAPINLGEEWDRPSVPFHVLLRESPGNVKEMGQRFRSPTAELVS